MTHRRGVTCQICAFEVKSSDPEAKASKWLAIASSTVYDVNVEVPGFNAEQAAQSGQTMRVIDGRAFGDTEAVAMAAALKALLFQLTAKGFSQNTDVNLW